MADDRDGHLSDIQIQECASQAPATGSPSVEAHLAECSPCTQRLLRLQRSELGFLESQGMRPNPYSDCPDEHLLRDLAAGLCPDETKAGLLDHAALCDHCGPLLHSLIQDFSEDYSPEIEAVLEKSPSANPGWRKATVRDLLRNERPRPKKSTWSNLPAFINSWQRAAGWATAAAVAALAILSGPRLTAMWELHQAKGLVETAFSKQRNTAMRLTGAPFGGYRPSVRTLGPGGGGNDTPELLEAKSKVRKEELKLPPGAELDPGWAQIEARIALLEGSGDSRTAEKVLKEALDRHPDDPGLEIDLAASYFETDMHSDVRSPNPAAPLTESGAHNLMRTIDLLNRVLKNPQLTSEQRSVALFDLAVAYQESNSLDLAAAKWEEYFQVTDPADKWNEEARRRQKEVKQGKPHDVSRNKDPAFFLEHASDSVVQNDVEQYQDFAFESWLFRGIDERDSEAAQALGVMADLMEQQHGDSWWRDFLQATGKDDLPAVQAFVGAYVADKNDRHDQSLHELQTARGIFHRRHNLPGELMTRFQEVYALQRIPSGPECLARAQSLATDLANISYHWMRGQVELEKATCANQVSKFKESQAYLDASLSVARQFHLPELRLRILGLEASISLQQKRYDEAWKQAVAGLGEFWQGSYSSERQYQFYSVMRQCAQEEGAAYAAAPLLLQSIELIKVVAPEDHILQAVLYLQAANVLLEQRDQQAAEEEAAKARTLLAAIPPGSNEQLYTAPAKLRLARFESGRGHADQALAALQSIRLPPGDDLVQLEFHAALGRVRLQLRQLDDASTEFQRGIRMAEMPSFHNDRGRLPWIKETEESYRGMVQVLLAEERNEEALDEWEKFKGRAFEKENPVPPNILTSAAPPRFRREEVAEPGAAEAVRLVYASFPQRLQVWTVRAGRVHSSYVEVTQSELRNMVDAFAKSSSTPDDSRLNYLDSQSQRLYKILLQPVLADLQGAQIVIVELDDPLAQLAVESLKSPNGWYFGEEYAVVYSPGQRGEKRLRQPVSLRPQDLLLVLDVSPHDGSGYLPGHDMVREAALGFHPHALLLSGMDAKPAAIARSLSASAAFHFFGHSARADTGTALDLGNGSLLQPQDFSWRRLERMRLAVLAACSSGTAENGLLDSGSLVRAFLAGGVPSILASHWSVDSQSTAELITSFYSHLASEPPVFALRDARKEILRGKRHPYYWAGVYLIGKSI